MALLGKAALAMWWDMSPQMRDEFQDWHTHEHFPERLSVPGFLRASRWQSADGGEGFFIMYDVRDFDVLVSPAYLAHLNSPTPWSTKLMPHHRNMVRSQCEVVSSEGGGVAGHAFTARMRSGEGLPSRVALLASRPGISGAHLLHARNPAIPQTAEQKIRGGNDKVAEWVVLVCGYDAAALRELAADAFGDADVAHHSLALSMVAVEVVR